MQNWINKKAAQLLGVEQPEKETPPTLPEPPKEDPRDRPQDAETKPSHGGVFLTGTVDSPAGGLRMHCLTIIGQIEGHFALPPSNKTTKYEHIIPQLVAIEEDPEIGGLLIILNTVGGDVEAGLAIAELIEGMRKPTVSLVLGGGHSIGVPLAVAAKRSFIVPTATMTIHPVRLNGLVLGVPQTLQYFERMQERITKFVVANSKISAKRFNELTMNTGELVMDIGTVLDGEAAVREGLIGAVGGLSDAIAELKSMIQQELKEKKQKSADKQEKPGQTEKPEAKGSEEKPLKSARKRSALQASQTVSDPIPPTKRRPGRPRKTSEL